MSKKFGIDYKGDFERGFLSFGPLCIAMNAYLLQSMMKQLSMNRRSGIS